MTRRRWIADHADGKSATLVGEQAAHLARVLRVQPGQVFDVVANGFLHRAEVVTADEREVVFTLHEELEAESALPVHLLMAVFKFDHMEWGIEKATELGVAKITPVIARRTDKHLAQAAAKRVERWRRIVREAAQQSRRSDVAEVDEPVALKVALSNVIAATKLLLAETEQQNSLASELASQRVSELADVSVALAIGPEGGWAPEEMALFSESGWKPVTLGPRILRAETAAIAGLAICAAYL
jgi:16S rRNA (uracil1498-N3)-methyltransferase